MTSKLQQLVERIDQLIKSIGVSAHNLKTVIVQTNLNVDKQKVGTQTIVSSMTEMSTAAAIADQNFALASKAAMDADKKAQQGIILVSALQSVMQNMQEESSRSQEAVERLVKDSNDIRQVSSAIKQIYWHLMLQ